MQTDYQPQSSISSGDGLQPENNKKKKSFLFFALEFVVILVLVGLGYAAWAIWLSPEAQLARQTQEQYEKYLSWQEQYEEAMKSDTFGGLTPQETLDMFVEALKEENVDLASKYFLLDENLSREKWVNALEDKKNKGELNEIINLLISAESAGSSMDGRFGFEIKNKEGEIVGDINMKLNKYSNIWKIESL